MQIENGEEGTQETGAGAACQCHRGKSIRHGGLTSN